MRWLMLTRVLDPDDEALGFTVRWVEALAARLDHLDIICQTHTNPPLPPNVRFYSMGKERGAGCAAQAWNLTRHLRRLTPQADGIFAHMIARYVWFAAPWARLHRKPILFWYTHRQISRELRLADALATAVMTAAPSSYPLPSPKVRVMGHGVAAELFPLAQGEAAPPTVIYVGRLSRIKRQDYLLRALAQVAAQGVGAFRVELVGGPMPQYPRYPAELEALARALPPSVQVTFAGVLPRPQAAEHVRQSALAVNLSPHGSFDKAALEAMLSGKPVVVSNADFLPLLGEAADLLYVPYDATEAALAERLARLLRMSPAERAAIGRALRERALAAHSLEGLMDRIVQLMQELTQRG